MPREELDLLEFAARQVAQPRTHVRRRSCGASFLDAGTCRRRSDDILHRTFGDIPSPQIRAAC